MKAASSTAPQTYVRIAWLISGLLREANLVHPTNIAVLQRGNPGASFHIFLSVGERSGQGSDRRKSTGHGTVVDMELLRSIYSTGHGAVRLISADISEPPAEALSTGVNQLIDMHKARNGTHMPWNERVSTEHMRWRWWRVYSLMIAQARRGHTYDFVFWQRPDVMLEVPSDGPQLCMAEMSRHENGTHVFIVPSALEREITDPFSPHTRDLDFAFWGQPHAIQAILGIYTWRASSCKALWPKCERRGPPPIPFGFNRPNHPFPCKGVGHQPRAWWSRRKRRKSGRSGMRLCPTHEPLPPRNHWLLCSRAHCAPLF